MSAANPTHTIGLVMNHAAGAEGPISRGSDAQRLPQQWTRAAILAAPWIAAALLAGVTSLRTPSPVVDSQTLDPASPAALHAGAAAEAESPRLPAFEIEITPRADEALRATPASG